MDLRIEGLKKKQRQKNAKTGFRTSAYADSGMTNSSRCHCETALGGRGNLFFGFLLTAEG